MPHQVCRQHAEAWWGCLTSSCPIRAQRSCQLQPHVRQLLKQRASCVAYRMQGTPLGRAGVVRTKTCLSPKVARVRAVRCAAARALKAQGLVQRSPSWTRAHRSRHCSIKHCQGLGPRVTHQQPAMCGVLQRIPVAALACCAGFHCASILTWIAAGLEQPPGISNHPLSMRYAANAQRGGQQCSTKRWCLHMRAQHFPWVLLGHVNAILCSSQLG